MWVFSWSIQSAHQRERSEEVRSKTSLLSECSSCLQGLAGTSMKLEPVDNRTEAEKPNPKSYVWSSENHTVGPCFLCHISAQPWFLSSDKFCSIHFRKTSARDLPGRFQQTAGFRTTLTHGARDKNKTPDLQNQKHASQAHFFGLNYLDNVLDWLVTYQQTLTKSKSINLLEL